MLLCVAMFDPVGIICYMLLHVNTVAAYGFEFAPHCMFLTTHAQRGAEQMTAAPKFTPTRHLFALACAVKSIVFSRS